MEYCKYCEKEHENFYRLILNDEQLKMFRDLINIQKNEYVKIELKVILNSMKPIGCHSRKFR